MLRKILLWIVVILTVIVLGYGGFVLERKLNWSFWYSDSTNTAIELAIQEHEDNYHQ